VTFAVAADSYDRFMGRYSAPLAPLFADFAGVTSGQHALDVGCGPGALTAELVKRLGAARVSAVDPSGPFVDAARRRHAGVDVRLASAEDLPFDDDTFDAVLAQLVVHFMTDPVGGLGEMARVARSGCAVSACVWDFAGGQAPLNVFWEAARELDPGAMDESHLAGARQGHLGELFHQAGLRDVDGVSLSVEVEHQSFEEWWEPFTLGVGPAGAYAKGLAPDHQAQLRERSREKIRSAPFVLPAHAWAARGRAA